MRVYCGMERGVGVGCRVQWRERSRLEQKEGCSMKWGEVWTGMGKISMCL